MSDDKISYRTIKERFKATKPSVNEKTEAYEEAVKNTLSKINGPSVDSDKVEKISGQIFPHSYAMEKTLNQRKEIDSEANPADLDKSSTSGMNNDPSLSKLTGD